MVNIFKNIIQKREDIIPNLLSDNKEFFIFENFKYPINDIIKITKLLPLKKYHIDVLSPILKNSQLNITNLNIISIAEYLDKLLTTKTLTEYLILLQLDDNHFKFIYGYEYFIKKYLNHNEYYETKIIDTNILQQLYIKLKKLS